MSIINLDKESKAVLAEMIDAARGILSANWTEAGPFVEMQSRQILDSIATIGLLKDSGRISEAQARLQLDIQREAFHTLLLTVKGIRRVQAENAVNAVLAVIGTAVNGIMGWSLL